MINPVVDYYILLFSLVFAGYAVVYAIELRRLVKYKRNDKCVYCGYPHGKKFSISYGMPGVLQIIKCKRWWCTLGKKLGYLEPHDYNGTLK